MMKTPKTNRAKSNARLIPALLLAAVFFSSCQSDPESSKQKTFASAEDAVVAMVEALKANEEDQLKAIFGLRAEEVMSSGDAVADQRGRDLFLAAYNERCVLVDDEEKKILHIGSEDWPFPIPLIRENSGWHFDTGAGIEELRYRRIGQNELATIRTCEAFVDSQLEYAQKGHDGKPAGIYAQKFASDPGKQNGLYWQTEPGEEESPLGELAAQASREGYTRSSEEPLPFRGYYFRILTSYGSSTNEGTRSYLVNGEMRNGFALLAFPAEYGKSGVMTFIVNQNGIVYERDLGEETAKLAEAMESYILDDTWKPANLQ
jgi:hypothetical protein